MQEAQDNGDNIAYYYYVARLIRSIVIVDPLIKDEFAN